MEDKLQHDVIFVVVLLKMSIMYRVYHYHVFSIPELELFSPSVHIINLTFFSLYFGFLRTNVQK